MPGLVAAGTLLPKALGSHAWQALPPAGPRSLPPARLSGRRPRYPATPVSPFRFTVEDGLVPQPIVAREPAHQRTVHPIVEPPAHIFPRNTRHGGEVALGDFLPDEDAPLA